MFASERVIINKTIEIFHKTIDLVKDINYEKDDE